MIRKLIQEGAPLQVVGVINAYTAVMAEKLGFEALYLSGAGVANASYGLPDLALTTLDNVCEDVRRITSATSLPLLVDADTGWGGPLMVARSVRELGRAGAAGCHLEDQIMEKRCGHRPNKKLIATDEMVVRIHAALDGRVSDDFNIMARTDAVALEGVEMGLERALAYQEAGADMIFAEALSSLEDFGIFTDALDVPVLANITEFGKTPLFTVSELGSVGVGMVLYPLSAFRAMNAAALSVYQAILCEGTQAGVVDAMQTRDELYSFLDYHEAEQRLDDLLGRGEG